jgi:hypothetical protein
MLYDPLYNPPEVGHNTTMTSSDDDVDNSEYSAEAGEQVHPIERYGVPCVVKQEFGSTPVTPDGWRGLLPLRAGSEGRGEQMPGTDWYDDRRGFKQEFGSTPVTQCDHGIDQYDSLYNTQEFGYVPVTPGDRDIDYMIPSYQVAKEAARYKWEWTSYCDDDSILSPTDAVHFGDGIVGNIHTQWSQDRTGNSGIAVEFDVSSYPEFQVGPPCFAHLSVTLHDSSGNELMTISNRYKAPERVPGKNNKYNRHGPRVIFKTDDRILHQALAVSRENPPIWALRFSATVWLYRSSDITGWGPQPPIDFHVYPP